MNQKHILILTSLLVTSTPALAQEEAPSFKSTEVTKGLFMIEGVGGFTGGNLGVLTGDDGVVLIDDALEPLASRVLDTVKSVAGADVDFVLNTHVHGDHIGGNARFNNAGATLIAHDNIRRRMLADAERDGKPTPAKESLPEITFSESATFHLNGHEAYVFHVAHAHTDGDAVIHFRKANVIHTGDIMFNGLFPFIDLDSGGSVRGYIAAQAKVLALADENTKIIPGHGPLGTKADLQAAADMLVEVTARVAALVKAGDSEEAVMKANPLADYHDDWNWGFITTEKMTKTLYRSLKGE